MYELNMSLDATTIGRGRYRCVVDGNPSLRNNFMPFFAIHIQLFQKRFRNVLLHLASSIPRPKCSIGNCECNHRKVCLPAWHGTCRNLFTVIRNLLYKNSPCPLSLAIVLVLPIPGLPLNSIL
jgi:hypothetical protein